MKRRIANPEKQPLTQPIEANVTWSMDFMEDRLENGRKVRTLNIIDDCNREPLMIEVQHSFPSEMVVKVVERVIELRGKPECIRTDNGTESLQKLLRAFARTPPSNICVFKKENLHRMHTSNALIEVTVKTCWMHSSLNR